MKNKVYFVIALLIGLVLFSCSSPQKELDKPNFLFILVDDLGWADLGVYGSTFHETPNLDKLANDGVMFTSAYAASPVCSPTRASIMTGKHPARSNTTDWFGARQPGEPRFNWMPPLQESLDGAEYVSYMDLDEITLAEKLKEAGYNTFIAGKWHLGEDTIYWPENQGFDINKGAHAHGRPSTSKGCNGFFSPYCNPRLEDGPEGEFLPERLARETIKFLESNTDKPFLAYYSLYSVHTPLQTKEELKIKYRAKKDSLKLEDSFGVEKGIKVRANQTHVTYAGMVEAMDVSIGMVLDKLKELHLDENTVVIFMSDNGGLASNSAPTSNAPLRSGKGWLYEGGVREPMIIKWPGAAMNGKPCSEPVISTDFYPTILEMAGIPLFPEQHIDGESLVPLLTGKSESLVERDALCWHYPHYSPQGARPGSSILKDNWKLIKNYEDNSFELYNLESDISESNDLSGSKTEKVKELSQELESWLERVDAKLPTAKTK